MNEDTSSSNFATTRPSRLLLGLVFLTFVLGAVTYWHMQRYRRIFQTGLAAHARNDLDAIHSAAEALRGVVGYEPHVHLLDGMILLRHHRLHEAVEQFGHAREHSADNLVLRAECLYGRNDQQAALDLLADALELAPDHLAGLQLAAMIELELGDAEAAARRLQRAIEHHPKEWRPRYQLLRAYHQLGEKELAEQEGERMKELRALRDRFTTLHDRAMTDPADAEIRYQLGLTAAELGWTELAESWFRTTLALDATHAPAQRALAAMHTPANNTVE